MQRETIALHSGYDVEPPLCSILRSRDTGMAGSAIRPPPSSSGELLRSKEDWKRCASARANQRCTMRCSTSPG